MKTTRRQFLKIGGAVAGATVGSGLLSNWWGLDTPSPRDPDTDGDRTVATFCELCFWKCGVVAHVKDGRVTKLQGNPKHPFSNGKLCPRGVGGTGLLYDPDRLKQPLLRVADRGQEKFEEVSWERALDEVATRLDDVKKKHGPEALALFSHGFGGSWFKQLVKAYGTPNIGAPSYAQCRGPRESAFHLTYGHELGSPEPVDMRNADCLTLIGAHLGENMHNTQVQDFADFVGSGGNLIVVDPRYSTAAGKADLWLPIKPGTDIGLLLAWMHVLISEERYDRAFVEKHCTGFEELAKYVANKTPEWAYVRTGIKPDLIRASARMIAGARPASLIHPGRRAVWYGNDTQRLRGVAIVNALLGNWGRKGGFLRPSKLPLAGVPLPKPPKAKKPLADQPKGNPYPYAVESLASGLRDAAIPGSADYDVKAWMVYGTNLIQSLPDTKKTIEAIGNLDFLVAIDVLPAEICGWADVVLPESTYLERSDGLFSPAYQEPFVAIRQKVVEPLYGSKPGWWIAKQLGERMGLGEYFPYEDADEVIAKQAEASGYDYALLKRDGVIQGKRIPCTVEEGLELHFATPSGKVELKSSILEQLGMDPFPRCTPPPQPAPGTFRLISGRAPMHTFGRTANNRLLNETYHENELWINADVAATLPAFANHPLKSGDRVMLINQDEARAGPVKVKVTQRIRGDCVFMVHGWGHTAKGMGFTRGHGASAAALTTHVPIDPVMGGTALNGNFVRLEPAQEAIS